MEIDKVGEGWRQTLAGIAMVNWSRLARWDAQTLSFTAARYNDFESSSGHQKVHPKYGRLICWLTFAVGAEYLCKGAGLLKGRDYLKPQSVIRPPGSDEDLGEWTKRVNANEDSVRQPELKSLTLGVVDPGDLLEPGPDRELVSASVRLLASTIRNRDAHRYAENVRTFHFHTVEALFVPTLNFLLATVDATELQRRLSEDGSS